MCFFFCVLDLNSSNVNTCGRFYIKLCSDFKLVSFVDNEIGLRLINPYAEHIYFFKQSIIKIKIILKWILYKYTQQQQKYNNFSYKNKLPNT